MKWGITLRITYRKGFLFFFILSICLSFYRVFLLDHHPHPFNFFHLFPTLMFNEMIDGLFPNYPDVLNFIPIALTDGILGILVVFLFKFLPTKLQKDAIFHFILLISFCALQWMIYNYVPVFMP
jgi:hypothetical protein